MKIQTFIKWFAQTGLIFALLAILSACARETPSFSLLSDSQEFKQSGAKINPKVDILWVVDNSGSMGPFQTNLRNNFDSFIKNFVSHGYDFQIAITTTDAYLAGPQFENYPQFAKFRDGSGTAHSNVFMVNPLTPNLINVFKINANQGEKGSGDERAFSSMKAALESPLNVGFPRADAFFAVIMLADEDDFSDPNRPEGSWLLSGGVKDHSYTNPGLESVQSYVDYLNQKTGSTPAARRYSVSAITVHEKTCLDAHNVTAPSSHIATRIIDLVGKTGGILGNICNTSYATDLDKIQDNILSLADQFYLLRKPVVSTIVVTIDGVVIPQDPDNGWTYDPVANSILFHGSALPPAGATVHVDFDPEGIR